ncbi:MAG: FKBP-type peptidyl-prolyl cis-trans isomerase, partial [Methanomassiliicoccales archaeon]
MSNEETDDAVKVSKGDVIRLEYDGWIEDTGEMFDTTDADKAMENDIFNENTPYNPIPLLVGAGRIFEGLEEALDGVEVGEEKEISLTPEQAAGERDPKLVELHPIREFHKKDIQPQMGMEVNINNRIGYIAAVTAGRVRVDFNRPLAGKNLTYRFKVTERIDDPEAKVQAIVEMDYGSGEDFTVNMEDDVIALTMPDVCKYDQKWLMAKYRVVSDLREAFGNVTIQFIEEYAKREEETAEESEELQPEEIPPESEEDSEEGSEEGSEGESGE